MDIESQIRAARAAVAGPDGVIRGRRKPRLGQPGGRGALFSSAKNQGFIPVRNRLERDYCFSLEADPMVAAYRTDALEFETSSHTVWPSFLLWDLDGNVLIHHVADSRQVARPEVKKRCVSLEAVARGAGIPLRIVTEKDIRERTNFDLLVLSYNRGGKHYSASEVIGPFAEFFESVPAELPTVRDLRIWLSARHYPAGYLEAAIFHQVILVADEDFGLESIVSVGEGDLANARIRRSCKFDTVNQNAPDEHRASGLISVSPECGSRVLASPCPEASDA